MFCNQSRFDLPTTIVTAEVFNNLVDSAQTKWLTKEHRKLREALPSILEGDAELLAQWANDENFIKFCQGQEAISKIKPRMRHLINVKKLHFLHF